MLRVLPRRAAFAATAGALAVFFFAAGAPSPLFPLYQAEWGFPTWMVTLAFGVYAIALLLALLVLGSLSDYVGRRPVLIGSLVAELGGMIMFLLSPSIIWLIIARIMQGVATAAATTAFSASMLELAPPGRNRLAAALTGTLPPTGLGLGALFSGLLATFTGSALTSVWIVLIVLTVAALAFAVITPEASTPMTGALASLRPHVAVPAQAARLFTATLPSQVAAWMISALFIGLLPTVLRLSFRIDRPLTSGVIAFVEQAAAGIVPLVLSRVRPQRVLAFGGVATVAGLLLFIAGISSQQLALLWVSAVVAGAGVGSLFTGTIRSLVPLAADDERAELFSAIYIVSYLAFGIPAIGAGLLIGTVGIAATSIGFGIVVIAAAALGFFAQRSSTTSKSDPRPS